MKTATPCKRCVNNEGKKCLLHAPFYSRQVGECALFSERSLAKSETKPEVKVSTKPKVICNENVVCLFYP
jgi:hypothetical protein